MDCSRHSCPPIARRVSRAILAACLVPLSGCLWRIPPSSATPGLLGNDLACPNWAEDLDVACIPYNPADIEIVGWVENQAQSRGVYGQVPAYAGSQAVSERESNYAAAMNRLMEDNDLDGVLNPVVDTRYWVLNFYVIKFSKVRTRLGGIGYRFREAGPDPNALEMLR